MRITLLQTDIVWENKQENLQRLGRQLERLSGQTDLVVLPETFSTGFSMNTDLLAETPTGETITVLRRYAAQYGLALAGSYIACDEHRAGFFFNRAFFLTPEGETTFYDKRHLFRMGREADHFTAGGERPVIHYQGWNILLLVCYDLRFPVWSRNVGNEYDLLIYVANWPAVRRRVWDSLLPARALENMSYVCGVNRVGSDGEGLAHDGGSVVFSPKGELLGRVADNVEGEVTVALSRSELLHFRKKFPAWEDADSFQIAR